MQSSNGSEPSGHFNSPTNEGTGNVHTPSLSQSSTSSVVFENQAKSSAVQNSSLNYNAASFVPRFAAPPPPLFMYQQSEYNGSHMLPMLSSTQQYDHRGNMSNNYDAMQAGGSTSYPKTYHNSSNSGASSGYSGTDYNRNKYSNGERRRGGRGGQYSTRGNYNRGNSNGYYRGRGSNSRGASGGGSYNSYVDKNNQQQGWANERPPRNSYYGNQRRYEEQGDSSDRRRYNHIQAKSYSTFDSRQEDDGSEVGEVSAMMQGTAINKGNDKYGRARGRGFRGNFKKQDRAVGNEARGGNNFDDNGRRYRTPRRQDEGTSNHSEHSNHEGEDTASSIDNNTKRKANDRRNIKEQVIQNRTRVNIFRKDVPIDEDESKNQRDELTEQLQRGTYECMVCCDRVRPQHAIWSCKTCYHCFHMGCIKKWAASSKQGEENEWRCPGCNRQSTGRPTTYTCFCGKRKDPEYNRRDVPHSCGELCEKNRDYSWCTHTCNVLCHPGPCPPCMAYIKRWCGCRATSKDVKCSITQQLICEGVCGKKLSCGEHECKLKCHHDSCPPCDFHISLECFCGKEQRSLPCTVENNIESALSFSCESVCGKALGCGSHTCKKLCHEGECEPCQLTVEVVTRCPCGKFSLKELQQVRKLLVMTTRKGCTDPIPTCESVCGKKLKCGKPGSFHTCQSKCHEGDCPPCPLKTPVRCRCGAMARNLACVDLTVKADEVTCDKQCRKLRFCGRHKCGTKCCIDVDHQCPLKCGKLLTCGKHRCQDSCHRGNCERCWQTSFDELRCHCGAEVIDPPVACGTKPPACRLPCTRRQVCQHAVTHECHAEPDCPPCTMLMAAPCFGAHKTMNSTPCHLGAISCGELCNKDLPCGLHRCDRVCHEGVCVAPARGGVAALLCPQKCTKLRPCGHPCNSACHSGPCPSISCKKKVTVTCRCGVRSSSVSCAENERENRALATARLATQLTHSSSHGTSVDISTIVNGGSDVSSIGHGNRYKRLECNDACAAKDRATKLALALQIENPEAKSSLGTAMNQASYSDFLKDETKKDPHFANMVHAALADLVIKARDSKQKFRRHSFAPMNKDKRQFIHEYCKFFGCTSQSYDEEPKKNVVVTAQRGMSLLPLSSVISTVQRENGLKKMPGPVWGPRKGQASAAGSSSNGKEGGMRRLEKGGSIELEEKPPAIDYFDFEG